jgi:hypothetical protein
MLIFVLPASPTAKATSLLAFPLRLFVRSQHLRFSFLIIQTLHITAHISNLCTLYFHHIWWRFRSRLDFDCICTFDRLYILFVTWKYDTFFFLSLKQNFWTYQQNPTNFVISNSVPISLKLQNFRGASPPWTPFQHFTL